MDKPKISISGVRPDSATKMAGNTSTHCAPPLNSFPPRRSPISFISRVSSTYYRSICFSGAPTLRIVAGHSQKPGSQMSAIMSETGAPSRSSSSSAASAIDFLTLCHHLKTTKRKGWINHGIKGPESIADHMYRMALMALIAGDLPGVNRERCIKIAIVHDIAEAIVGDITPSDGVPKEEKSRREQAALTEMCKILGGGMRAEEIQELWAEYENNTSLEANLVKDFDKVEMILQALEYEMGKFQTEIGKSWAAEITSRRNSRLAEKPNSKMD
ncbi:hypothetical protein REPUB_Repub01dG0001300 [Reevesia pubescens]